MSNPASTPNITESKVDNGYVFVEQNTGRMVEVFRPTKTGNPWSGFDFSNEPTSRLVVQTWRLREARAKVYDYLTIAFQQAQQNQEV
jgi:hypothetical protein